ncbi:hypothetical protein FRC08_016020, partial [Ceratobasidium sp. 394]
VNVRIATQTVTHTDDAGREENIELGDRKSTHRASTIQWGLEVPVTVVDAQDDLDAKDDDAQSDTSNKRTRSWVDPGDSNQASHVSVASRELDLERGEHDLVGGVSLSYLGSFPHPPAQ